jgi:formiminotetrahydrofolate cyclodeaminase
VTGSGDGQGGWTGLRSLGVGELLGAVSARTPAPGGGGVTALATALAAGLAAMAARFAADEDLRGLADEADDLRDRAAALADADGAAYTAVLAAYALPREPDPGARTDQIRRARSEASEVPVEVAEVAVRVARTAARLAAGGNPNLRGDAGAAVHLATAAARTAALLVAENLSDQPDDPRPSRTATLAEEAAALADTLALPHPQTGHK